jgi:Na+-driven multidrug efflux pump
VNQGIAIAIAWAQWLAFVAVLAWLILRNR